MGQQGGQAGPHDARLAARQRQVASKYRLRILRRVLLCAGDVPGWRQVLAGILPHAQRQPRCWAATFGMLVRQRNRPGHVHGHRRQAEGALRRGLSAVGMAGDEGHAAPRQARWARILFHAAAPGGRGGREAPSLLPPRVSQAGRPEGVPRADHRGRRRQDVPSEGDRVDQFVRGRVGRRPDDDRRRPLRSRR